MRIALVLVVLGAVIGVLAWANWPAGSLPASAVADRVVITKSRRSLALMSAGRLLKEYRIALGRNPLGPKEREGDRRTPEGLYRVTEHKRDSAFHRALRISYPEMRDLERARDLGVPPGSDIMIHGIRNGLGWLGRLHRSVDWTSGCIAVTDAEIEEIWRAVADDTPVEIRP